MSLLHQCSQFRVIGGVAAGRCQHRNGHPRRFQRLAVQLAAQQLRRTADVLGRTVVIVMHDINFAAAYADKIVAMNEGSVSQVGTPVEIMRPDVLQDIFHTPFEVVDGPAGPLAVYY